MVWQLIEIPERVSVSTMLRLALTRGGRAWRLGAASVGLMVHQAGEVAVPVLVGVIIDRAIEPGRLDALVLWLAVLAAVFLVLSLSYQRASLAMVRVYGHGEHDLRQLTVARVLHPRRHPSARREGEVLSVATSDTFRVAGVAWSIAEQAATLAAILVAALVLLLISVPLGIGVVVGAGLVLWGMQALAGPIEIVGMAEQTSVARASEVAADTVAGLRVVHGLGAEDEVVRRYRAASADSRRGAIAAGRMMITYEAASTAVSVVYLVLLTVAAGWLVLEGQITPGQLLTVVGLAQFLQGSLGHVGTFGANWAHKRASARRLRTLVAEPFVLDGGTGAPAGEGPLLEWRVGGGETVVVVQPGSGLIGVRASSPDHARRVSGSLGFRERPRAGELLLHGVDATEIGPVRFAQHVVAPPHDARLFTGTLRANVSEDGVLDRDILAATAVDDVIAHLGSSDALVGEAGHRLSGGQRQRILLARALHAAGDVVVLDDPTTALDPLTEYRVARRLRDLERPIVVVTTSRILLAACTVVCDAPPLDPPGERRALPEENT